MADNLTRKRFLTDVLFVGGGLLAAALVAAGLHYSMQGEDAKVSSTQPVEIQSATPTTPDPPCQFETPSPPTGAIDCGGKRGKYSGERPRLVNPTPFTPFQGQNHPPAGAPPPPMVPR